MACSKCGKGKKNKKGNKKMGKKVNKKEENLCMACITSKYPTQEGNIRWEYQKSEAEAAVL